MSAILSELFADVTRLEGEEYLEREARLTSAGQAAIAFLLDRSEHEVEPLRAFIANTLTEWISLPELWALYDRVMESLDLYEHKAEKSPLGSPRPDIVAREITIIAGARLTRMLALRMLKDRSWPSWKVRGVLAYLVDHHDAATLLPIQIYAATTRNRALRGEARTAAQRIAAAMAERAPESPSA